jgi:hypothetical protein
MISTSMNNVPLHEFLSAPAHCTVYLIYIITDLWDTRHSYHDILCSCCMFNSSTKKE